MSSKMDAGIQEDNIIVLEERKYNIVLGKNKRRSKHDFLVEQEPLFLKGGALPHSPILLKSLLGSMKPAPLKLHTPNIE